MMKVCKDGHYEVVYDDEDGCRHCPLCALGDTIEHQDGIIGLLRADLKAAAKPSPYKKRYVLGEGYPTAGCWEQGVGFHDVWLRASPKRVGRTQLQWPGELEGNLVNGQPPDLPPYRLVLELVEEEGVPDG